MAELMPFKVETYKISDYGEVKASGLIVRSLVQPKSPTKDVPDSDMPWLIFSNLFYSDQ